MKITTTYMENLAFKTDGNAKEAPGSNGAANFRSVMDKTVDNLADRPQQKQKAETEKKYAPVQRTVNPQPTRENADVTKPAENVVSEQAVPDAPDVKPAAPAATAPAKPVEAEPVDIPAQIAAILNIPIVAVIELLGDLGIQAIDLADKPQLHLFLQQFHNVDNPVELLTVPDINETIVSIENAVQQAAPEQSFVSVLEGVIANQTTETPVETVAYTPVQPVVQAVPQVLATSVTTEAVVPEDIVADPELAVNENAVVRTAPEQPSSEAFTQTQQQTAEQFAPADEPQVMVRAEDGEVIITGAQQTATRVTALAAEQIRAPEAPREIINQIADRIRVDVRGNITELRLLLRPESLGEVSLRIATINGIVTAQFIAENQRVRQIIEANFGELKEALAERGVEVGELSVSVGDNEANEAMESYLRESYRAARSESQTATGPEITDATLTAAETAEDIYGSTVNYVA